MFVPATDRPLKRTMLQLNCVSRGGEENENAYDMYANMHTYSNDFD